MGRAVDRWALDTFVSSFAPSSTGNTSSQVIWVTNGSRVGFIHQNLSAPLGAKILSAKLRLTSEATTASAFVELSRSRKRPAYSWLSWNNEPGGIPGSGVLVSQNAGARTWEFDVRSHMQYIADGGAWYGWRLEATNPSGDVRFFSQESGKGPVLEIEWSDRPFPPTALSPSGGRSVSVTKPVVRFDVVDVAGDTTLSAVRVQISNSDTMSPLVFDSAWEPASAPELDLSKTMQSGAIYPGASAGTPQFWRANVRDGAGEESGWSQVTSFNYDGKGSLAVTSPSASGLTISDNTPVVAWTLTGRTQAAYQVIVARTSEPSKWLWTSRKVTSSTSSITVPKKVITRDDVSYRITVRVWDTIDRVASPGHSSWYQVSRDVTFDDDAAVAPVASLSAEAIGGGPVVELVATRATTPDRWMILRGNDIIGSFAGAELRDVGTTYKFTDYTAPGMHEARYRFQPVENGRRAWGNPVSAVYPESRFAWLLSLDGSHAVPLANVDLAWEVEPQQEILTPLGARRPVMVRQSRGSRSGTVAATIATDLPGAYGATTADHKAALDAMESAAETVRLVVGDENIPVVIHSLVMDPLKWDVSGTVSFAFFQDGELPEGV